MGKTVETANAFTYTEWHAAVLGAVVGLVAVSLQEYGSQQAAVGLVSLFVLAALGFKARERLSKGQRTIRKEPWYALGGLVAGGVVALAVAMYLV